MSFKIWVAPYLYTISYQLGGGAPTKSLEIKVNGTTVVTCGDGGCNGDITITPGDYVEASVACSTTFPLLVSLDFQIVDNGSTLYSNSQSGNSSASDGYGPYYPSGNGTINADTTEY